MTTLTARIDVKLGRGQNEREHHRVRANRVQAERQATGLALSFGEWAGACQSLRRPELGASVTLTRPFVAVPLDSDNLSAAFKAPRDAIATFLGVDDGSNRLHWVYRQERARVVGKSQKAGKSRPSLDHDTRPTVRIEVLPIEDIDPQRRAVRILRAFAVVVERFSVHTHDEHGVRCLLCLASRVLTDTHDQEQP